jgi:hypothetical protein
VFLGVFHGFGKGTEPDPTSSIHHYRVPAMFAVEFIFKGVAGWQIIAVSFHDAPLWDFVEGFNIIQQAVTDSRIPVYPLLRYSQANGLFSEAVQEFEVSILS